ncbi:response regulator [Pontiellaceae bacterium B12219]|nr:response regulator [Pontiellaceae bacterium B12219]
MNKLILETDKIEYCDPGSRPTGPSPAPPKAPALPRNLTGNLLATTSHEIRTALNSIVGMAQLVADTNLTREQQTYIDTILESMNGLIKSISYVMDISKIETGQMDIHDEPVDLREMCSTLHRMFRPRTAQKRVNLECECMSNVPLSVMCDERIMERVLNNLITHALKGTSEAGGSIKLSIECIHKSSDGAALSVHVSSTGSLQDLPEGGESAASRNSDDNLLISKQLIELMGGRFDVIRKTEHSSIYRMNLTLRQANRPAAIHLAVSDRVTTITPGTRVLLAEDNRLNQKVILSILRKAGCEVDAVENGEKAIQFISENRYDIILMDCQMPVMDGFEATARIRSLSEPKNNIPIIALTAHTMKGDKQKCLESGMNAYLPKPIGRQDLIDVINDFSKARK